MDRSWCVYSLIDPRNGSVRYIGWTVNLHQRLRDHLKPSRLNGRQRRDRWLKNLADAGLRPACEILETASGDGWAAAERRWIARYRSEGADLTNLTDGGEGTPGRKHTAETKAKMSVTRKGRFPAAAMTAYIAKHKGEKRSPEMIEKLAAGLRGKPKSEAHKVAIATTLRGRTLSAEHRANVSAAMRGKKRGPMPEAQRRQLSDAKKGVPNRWKRDWWAALTPEERSEIAHKSATTKKRISAAQS